MSKLLLVEDEEHIGHLLKKNFEVVGYEVLWLQDGGEALDKIELIDFDCAILDIMLPKVDGLTLLKMIKNKKNAAPVLMLSSKDTVDDRIIGLELNADDYLGKPFNFKELLLRVKNLLKNKKNEPKSIEFFIGDWSIDEQSCEAKKGEISISLSSQEFDLLFYLYQFKNTFVSRGDLLKNVWRVDPKTKTRSVDIFISRLRKYFEEDPSKPEVIISKRLRGYMLKI